MQLPENTVFVEEFSENDYYTIDPGQTHVIPFAVFGTKATRLRFAHSMWEERQQFSLDVWVSRTPCGDFLYDAPLALQRFHPTAHEMTVVLYPIDNDFLIRTTEIGDAMFDDMAFDEERIEMVKKRDFGLGVFALRVKDIGSYYLNIRNLTNRDNGYSLRIDREELPRP